MWNTSLPQNSIGAKLKPVVSKWFEYFRGIALIVYLIMLIYVGIRIIFYSTGKGLDEAKQKLLSWTAGVLVLVLGPMIMQAIIQINDSLVSIRVCYLQDAKNNHSIQ